MFKFAVLMMLPALLQAQTVAITGKIVDRASDGVADCQVSLEGTNFSTTSAAGGEFTLSDISPVSDLRNIGHNPVFANGSIELNIVQGIQPVSVRAFTTAGKLAGILPQKSFSQGSHSISLKEILTSPIQWEILLFEINIGAYTYHLKSYGGLTDMAFGGTRRSGHRGTPLAKPASLPPGVLNIDCEGRPVRNLPLPTTLEDLGEIKIFAQPNFVIVLTDDQGYADLGVFGSGTAPAGGGWLEKDRIAIPTPRIDQMAAEGMIMTSFYSSTYCGPARAQLMTGCYPTRIAKRDNQEGSLNGLFNGSGGVDVEPSELTMAELLKDAGYATGMIGKWHIGIQDGYKPVNQGFDYWWGARFSNDPGWFPLYENETYIEDYDDMAHVTQDFTTRAISWISDHKDEPFFMWLAHSMPHVKIDASENFKGTLDRLYSETIAELDYETGLLLDSLKAFGVDENTVVVFFSDNGHWGTREDAGSGYPLRGGKISQWEGGHRVPFVIRGPGIIPPGGESDEIVNSTDLLPTFVNLAGGTVPTDRVIDGKDIEPLLRQEEGAVTPHEAHYYWKSATLTGVRMDKWKLHVTYNNEEISAGALYDLEADIGESDDVSGSNAAIVSQVMDLANGAIADMGDLYTIGSGERRAP